MREEELPANRPRLERECDADLNDPNVKSHREIQAVESLLEEASSAVVNLAAVFRQAARRRIHEGLRLEFPTKNVAADFYFVEKEPEQIAPMLVEMVKTRIPAKYNLDPIQDIQVLCPMNRGPLGIRRLNVRLQAELNPKRPTEPFLDKGGRQFRIRDKVIQTENYYHHGRIGQVVRMDPMQQEVVLRFGQREVVYDYGEMDEFSLAYAITVHQSQRSAFPAVVIPLAIQQYTLLQRNLVYTGIMRGKKLVVVIGQNKALALAVRNN
jgi:exodeoxyribonuclease V alpha subunit